MPCPRGAVVSDTLERGRAQRLALGVAWAGLMVVIVSAGAASTLELAEPPDSRADRSSRRLERPPSTLAARDQAWQLWVGVSRNGGPTAWQPLGTLPDRGGCEAALTATLEERRKGYREIGVFELLPLPGEGFVRVDEGSLDVHAFRFRCTPAAREPGSQRDRSLDEQRRGDG